MDKLVGFLVAADQQTQARIVTIEAGTGGRLVVDLGAGSGVASDLLEFAARHEPTDLTFWARTIDDADRYYLRMTTGDPVIDGYRVILSVLGDVSQVRDLLVHRTVEAPRRGTVALLPALDGAGTEQERLKRGLARRSAWFGAVAGGVVSLVTTAVAQSLG